MCPGGEERALDIVMPLLRKVAAKDSQGNPCVAKAGTGGSGHYIKMIHNGIEHGMMSALAEAWQIMNLGLLMSYDEIAAAFDRWNEDGELVSRRDDSLSPCQISRLGYTILLVSPLFLNHLLFHRQPMCHRCRMLGDTTEVYAKMPVSGSRVYYFSPRTAFT